MSTKTRNISGAARGPTDGETELQQWWRRDGLLCGPARTRPDLLNTSLLSHDATEEQVEGVWVAQRKKMNVSHDAGRSQSFIMWRRAASRWPTSKMKILAESLAAASCSAQRRSRAERTPPQNTWFILWRTRLRKDRSDVYWMISDIIRSRQSDRRTVTLFLWQDPLILLTHLTNQELEKFSWEVRRHPPPPVLLLAVCIRSRVQIFIRRRDIGGVVGMEPVLSCDELSGLRLCASNPAIPLKSDLIHRSPA